MNTPPPAAAGRRRFWRQFLSFGEWVVEGEELPRDEEEAPTQRTGPSPVAWLASADPLPSRMDSPPHHQGFLHWLVWRHPLPIHSDSPPRHAEFLRWLASRDPLPNHYVSSHRHPGFFAWLTEREGPPSESPERTPASRSILRWFLTTEPDDRLESLHSTKEVPPHES